MWIRDRIVHTYDIEIFPNCFHCCVKNTETGQLYRFEISERRNQLDELVDFFYYDSSDKLRHTKMFCGYNNHHYDDVIINCQIYLIGEFVSLSLIYHNALWKTVREAVRSSNDGSMHITLNRWTYSQ